MCRDVGLEGSISAWRLTFLCVKGPLFLSFQTAVDEEIDLNFLGSSVTLVTEAFSAEMSPKSFKDENCWNIISHLPFFKGWIWLTDSEVAIK